MKSYILFIAIVFLLSSCSITKTSKQNYLKADIDTILRLTLLFSDTISGFDKNIPIKFELKNISKQVLFINNPSYLGITYLRSNTLLKRYVIEPNFEEIYNSFIQIKPNETLLLNYSIFLDNEYYIDGGSRDLSLVYCGKIKNEKGLFIDYKENLKSNNTTFYIKPDRLILELKKNNKAH